MSSTSHEKMLSTTQPGKTIWTTVAILYTLCRLPLLCAIYAIPSLRPHRQWTFRQSLMNSLMHAFLYHSAFVEARTPLGLKAGKEGDRFVGIPHADKALYRGVLKDSEIVPVPTGGIWYPSRPAADTSDDVVVHFHGGGYAIGEGRPGDAAYAATILTKFACSNALFVSYRLASNPLGRFPAALQDAVSAYAYLLSRGIKPSQIIVSGDSAGGHIAISLIRYLSSNPGVLPGPKAALLWSPAVDLTAARNPTSITGARNYNTDYLAGNFVAWGAGKFSSGVSTSSDLIVPYVSPLGHSFATKTPIWLSVGGFEVFYDEVMQFCKEMQAVAGNKVELNIIPKAPHDVMFVANIMGWESEAEDAGRAAQAFLNELNES